MRQNIYIDFVIICSQYHRAINAQTAQFFHWIRTIIWCPPFLSIFFYYKHHANTSLHQNKVMRYNICCNYASIIWGPLKVKFVVSQNSWITGFLTFYNYHIRYCISNRACTIFFPMWCKFDQNLIAGTKNVYNR